MSILDDFFAWLDGLFGEQKAPAPSPTRARALGSAPGAMITAGTIGTTMNAQAVRTRLMRAGILNGQGIDYRSAGVMTAAGHVALVGDIEVEIRDKEDRRTMRLLLSSVPRGDELTGMIAQDVGPGVASARNYLTVGTTNAMWPQGNPIPSSVANRPAYLNPTRIGHYRVSEFALDIADAIGITPVYDVYLVGTSTAIFRSEQALKRKRTLWTEIFKPLMPTLTSMLSIVVAGVVPAGTGKALSGAIAGFVSSSMTIIVAAADRRLSIDQKLGVAARALASQAGAFTEICGLSIEFGARSARWAPHLGSEMMEARRIMETWGADREIAAAITNTEARVRGLRSAVVAQRAPYEIKRVSVYT